MPQPLGVGPATRATVDHGEHADVDRRACPGHDSFADGDGFVEVTRYHKTYRLGPARAQRFGLELQRAPGKAGDSIGVAHQGCRCSGEEIDDRRMRIELERAREVPASLLVRVLGCEKQREIRLEHRDPRTHSQRVDEMPARGPPVRLEMKRIQGL